MTRALERRSPEEAFAWADALPLPPDVEAVPLADAAGRVLGRALDAQRDVPLRREAAADGFALRASDTIGAGDYSPLVLGVRPDARRLAHGEAGPVQWGDPMPDAADAVLPLECAEIHDGRLEVTQSLAPGDGMAEPGEECRAGDRLFAQGHRLRPQDLACLSRAGRDEVPVWRRPVVRLVTAGRYDVDADGPMLARLAARDGGCVQAPRRAGDASALAAALAEPGADVVLVVGGTGDGRDDHAVASLQWAGAVDIHRVAIHPGGNVALGRAGRAAVVLLPGAPLDCFCAYDLLAARVVRRMARLAQPWPYRSRTLPLASKLASAIGRLDLCRVRVRDGRVEPLAVAEGRILATVVRADGFVVVPAGSEGHGRGADVVVHLYED